MTFLVFEEADEEIARFRFHKLTTFVLNNGAKVSSATRRYVDCNGDEYVIDYSLNRLSEWQAKFVLNGNDVCYIPFPDSWYTSKHINAIWKAKLNPINDDRQFLGEFYDFVEDYSE